MPSVNTGTASKLRLESWVSATSFGERWSDVTWQLFFEEISSSTAWVAGSPGVNANVFMSNIGTVWSGSFGFDWRPGGNQSVQIASGTNRVYHNPDGTPPGGFGLIGNTGPTGTGGGGGGASVTHNLSLSTLKVIPGTPTGIAAVRISDTQATVSWNQSSASNGQPYSNQIERAVTGGPFSRILDISATTSTTASISPNQKISFRVQAWNDAGFGGMSGNSVPIYTTPGAPTLATATKESNLNVTIGFVSNVAYAEHTHEVWHGVVSGGVTTWDGATLATLASGITAYTHVTPNASQVHVYRVRSRAGALASGYSTTNSVQLLVAPNKPTVPAMPAFADKASSLVITWTHNPIDTSPQKAYEFSFSTNGGSTWSTSGKITGIHGSHTVAASSYAANVALTTRVRTWGSATTGGSEGTGASVWSDLTTVTFKTIPVATVIAPANASTISDATVRATLGFSQTEAATFVKATVQLKQGATLLEELDSNILVGITLATQVQTGVSYSILARVQDSNGLWSTWKTNTFSVAYLAPVPAGVALTYLPDTGYGQIDLTLPAPRQSAVTRTNLCTNPNFELDILGYTAEAGAVLTRETASPISGSGSLRISGGGDAYTLVPVPAGKSITFSLDYKTVGTVAGLPRLYASVIGEAASQQPLPLTQITSSRFSIVSPVADSAGTVVLAVFAPTADGSIIVDNVLIESSDTAGAYLDGSKAPSGEFTYAWTGAANASTSTQTISGQSAATTVSITRKINGVDETVVQDYPVASQLTFLDTTPTIHGTNTYTITTTSALGAKATVVRSLVTTECRKAFLSKGVGFSVVVAFGANLSVSESLSVASDTVEAAGRIKPIGLYGVETSVSLKVSSFIFEGFGSTIEETRSLLLLPGKACYRDGSGRRVFGSVKGSLSYKKDTRGDLSFTLTETS